MNDLIKLLNDFILKEDDKEYINIAKIKTTDKIGDRLYKGYTNPNEIGNIQGLVEKVAPVSLKYIPKRLWLVNETNRFEYDNGYVLAFQDGLNVLIPKGKYLEAGEVFKEDAAEVEIEHNVSIQAETEKETEKFQRLVYLFNAKKIIKPSENYYTYCNGDQVLELNDRPVIRFYFNVKPIQKDFLNFINEIKDYLNDRLIGFNLKYPSDFSNFNRSDTVVLYVFQNHYYYLIEFIRILSQKYNNLFRNQLPLFVKRLCVGIGLAEDPMGAESFGEHRVNLILKYLISKNENKILFSDLRQYLVDLGYNSNELFRSINTNFDYDKELNLVKIKIKQIKGDFKFETYNKLATNLALELIEKAIWISHNDITWCTYDKDGNKYRIINKLEKEIIFNLLNDIIRIEGNDKYFPKNVFNLILENKPKDNKFVKNNTILLCEFFKKFDKLISTNFISILKDIDFDDNYESLKLHSYNWVERIIKGFRPLNINIHQIAKKEFKSKNAIKAASQLYNLIIKYDYPIKNKYENYEFDPISKVQIISLLFYVYCPELLETN